MGTHNDLKGINTPLLLYMINLFDPDDLRSLSPTERLKEEKTLSFLQHEMDNRSLIDSTIEQATKI